MKTLAYAVLALTLSASTVVFAQAPPAVARGTILALQADSITLKAEDGTSQTYGLAKELNVSILKKVDLDAIKEGSFIGTAEMPVKEGRGRSLEVHVFPPGVKAGEGHYPWDLKKGSMMTNGTVGKVTSTAKGSRVLSVTYPNGERKITVPKSVPIVQFTTGDRAALKPGIPAFLILIKTPDGKLVSPSIAIGENGAKPPM